LLFSTFLYFQSTVISALYTSHCTVQRQNVWFPRQERMDVHYYIDLVSFSAHWCCPWLFSAVCLWFSQLLSLSLSIDSR